MLRLRMNVAAMPFVSLLIAATPAQCLRPSPPAGGFPTDLTAAVPVTYSDGYQTNGALIAPAGTPPSCGWPLVVFVHYLGGNRFSGYDRQVAIAQQGYAVWTYDVRGQGEAALLNPGHAHEGTTLWGPIEGHDLAEQILFVAAEPTFQGLVDTSRLAVIGSSQGGGHAWMAAAWSGDLLSTPGRAPVTFPTVSCVAPRDLVGSGSDDWLRGELFSSWWVEAANGSYPGLLFDPAFVAASRAAFVAQDPSALRAAWAADGRDLTAELATSTVPVLFGQAYHDLVHDPLPGLRHLEAMPGPGRALLSTLGHGVPGNDLERAAYDNLQLRWLHHHLWGYANEVELEVPHVLSVMPLDATERNDPSYAWSRSYVMDLRTPPDADRFFLTDGFTLQATAPLPPFADVRVDQEIDPLATSFTPADYFDQPAVRDLAAVLAACPLDDEVWSLTLTANSSLLRSATVHLELEPDASSWMVAALLTVEPPGGDEVMLAAEAVSSRQSVPGLVEQHDLRLPPVAVDLPAGTVVRLRLRNLWLQEFPMTQRLDAAPMFGDFSVRLRFGPGPGGCWLDLPLEASPPRMVSYDQDFDLATGGPATGAVRGGVEHAGDPYFVTVGLSGSTPGSIFLGKTMPIDGDWLVVSSVASTEPYYLGFFGNLDALGEGQWAIDYSVAAPLPRLLNGLHLTVAAFVWDAAGAMSGEPTNHCELLLR